MSDSGLIECSSALLLRGMCVAMVIEKAGADTVFHYRVNKKQNEIIICHYERRARIKSFYFASVIC